MSRARNLRGGRRGFNVVELLVSMLILNILLAIAVPQWKSYMIRVRVMEALVHAGKVQRQVADNAFNGMRFDSGVVPWVPTVWVKKLEVDLTYGSVVVTFGKYPIDGQTLILFPKDKLSDGTLQDLQGYVWGSRIPEGSVQWGCRTAGTIGAWTKGTLLGEYAPQECRAGTMYNAQK